MPRVLVIDDEHALRSLVVELLASEGYEVDSAEDGAGGLEVAQRMLPDLILCDIVMKGLDGFDVLSALRRDPRTAAIPVVFLTGRGEPHDLRRGMNLGADDYLVKPVTGEEICKAVTARIARHKQLQHDVQQRAAQHRTEIAQALPHEFLTPLTAVMGLSSMLLDDPTTDLTTVREAAQGIFLGSQKLQETTTKFLAYAELGALPDGYARGAMDPGPAAELMAKTANERAARAGRTRDLDLELRPIAAPLGRDLLGPVVQELAENAFAYSASGTRVRIESGDDGGAWQLRVVDQGRGMSTAQIAALETHLPFSRRHQDQPGVGLGLALVRRIARLGRGELRFESVVSRGTTVSLRMAR